MITDAYIAIYSPADNTLECPLRYDTLRANVTNMAICNDNWSLA